MLALRTIATPTESAPRALNRSGQFPVGAGQLGHYVLLRRLEGGLRADVWIAVPATGEALADVVLLKIYFPHDPGAALDGLSEELTLAKKLTHDNIARTLHVGTESDRPFLVSEYLEGTTLRTLLRRAAVAGVSMPQAAVGRVLLALVAAVRHAQQQAGSVVAKQLVNQLIPADDVFITYEGDVKVLGFKTRLQGLRPSAPDSGLGEGHEPAAVDALLSEHLTAELHAVLAAATESARGRPFDGLWQLGQALTTWQAEELDNDGRAELAALMGSLLAVERIEQRGRLEVTLEDALEARRESIRQAELAEEPPPVSGYRSLRS